MSFSGFGSGQARSERVRLRGVIRARHSVLIAACALIACQRSAQKADHAQSPPPRPRAAKAVRAALAEFSPLRSYDPFSKDTTIDLVITSNQRAACSHGGENFVVLTLSEITDQYTPRTFLVLDYIGKEWLFIQGGLEILEGDSVRYIDLGTKSDGRVNEDGSVSERAVYVVTRDDLERMLAQDTVAVRLDGTRGRCDFVPTQQAMASLQLFVDSVMAPRDTARTN